MDENQSLLHKSECALCHTQNNSTEMDLASLSIDALNQECYKALDTIGLVLLLNHNTLATSAKVLGEKSSIIDIEHTYLYNPLTATKMLEKHNIEIIEKGKVMIFYFLHYFTHPALFPQSYLVKLLTLMKKFHHPDKVVLSLPIGNMYLIARKKL
jgi:hypothetical protein